MKNRYSIPSPVKTRRIRKWENLTARKAVYNILSSYLYSKIWFFLRQHTTMHDLLYVFYGACFSAFELSQSFLWRPDGSQQTGGGGSCHFPAVWISHSSTCPLFHVSAYIFKSAENKPTLPLGGGHTTLFQDSPLHSMGGVFFMNFGRINSLIKHQQQRVPRREKADVPHRGVRYARSGCSGERGLVVLINTTLHVEEHQNNANEAHNIKYIQILI